MKPQKTKSKNKVPADVAGALGSAVGGIVGTAVGAIASGLGHIASEVLPQSAARDNTSYDVSSNGITYRASLTPSDEQISWRAYEIYLAEGCPEGRSLEHWLQARHELSQASGA